MHASPPLPQVRNGERLCAAALEAWASDPERVRAALGRALSRGKEWRRALRRARGGRPSPRQRRRLCPAAAWAASSRLRSCCPRLLPLVPRVSCPAAPLARPPQGPRGARGAEGPQGAGARVQGVGGPGRHPPPRGRREAAVRVRGAHPAAGAEGEGAVGGAPAGGRRRRAGGGWRRRSSSSSSSRPCAVLRERRVLRVPAGAGRAVQAARDGGRPGWGRAAAVREGVGAGQRRRRVATGWTRKESPAGECAT